MKIYLKNKQNVLQQNKKNKIISKDLSTSQIITYNGEIVKPAIKKQTTNKTIITKMKELKTNKKTSLYENIKL